MKLTLFALLLLSSIAVVAQKNESYKAVNGITYKIGDTVSLGKGSGTNQQFLHLQLGGWAAVASYNQNGGADQMNIGRGYANTQVIVKKIKSGLVSGKRKTYFVVSGGNISNYNLVIDDAIDNCEVIPCKNTQSGTIGVADELIKLKQLLDTGAITKEEYDKQKAKVLNN